VIVSCPRCHKQYRLDTSRLNYINLPDNSGHGVQLACSNCHEQWWELKKESINTNQKDIKIAAPEQPFRNLTDISLLYKKPFAKHTDQSPNISFSASNNAHHHFSPQQKSPKKDIAKPKQWKTLLLVIFWSLLIFGGTISLAFVAMQFDHPLLNFSSDSEKQISPDVLIIENIHFDVKPVDNEQQKIIVVGQVKNSGQLATPLQNIQLKAWGTCQPDQTPKEEGFCQIRTWSYKWKQELIQPNEELTFKSAAKIPAHLQVDQVHVDIPPNQ
jgi:hypothetical protein